MIRTLSNYVLDAFDIFGRFFLAALWIVLCPFIAIILIMIGVLFGGEK